MKNIVLIGMPGSGKSTIGVLLAKATGREFVDTDLIIQAREGRSLQTIIEADGLEAFCALEECYILTLQCQDSVVATGGSAVYSDAAMAHLKRHGVIVHLDVPLKILRGRLRNLSGRGVVKPPDVSLAALFERRQPLYQKWADITICCEDLTHEGVVAAILETQ
ncbi:MAG: shikimate kinase [Kiritimatiellales bacterium]|nr:shikimate kinase [Kiritimatiellales bacterium]